MNHTLEIGTDCSGVEAPIQALIKLGVDYKHVFSCDSDKYVKQVIQSIYKPHHWYDNLMTRDNSQIPPVNLYVAGFPCQAFSFVGNKKGFDDIRGTVFFGVADYLQKQKPDSFVLENVKGLVSHDKGKTFQTILEILAGNGTINGQMSIPYYDDGLDYHIYYKILNSKEYGVPQNRERVFIIGFRNFRNFSFPRTQKLNLRLKHVLQEKVDDKYYLSDKMITWAQGHSDKHQAAGNGFKFKQKTGEDIADCLNARYYKMGADDQYIQDDKGIRRLTPFECFRLQGFPDSFHQELTELGISDTQMYKMAGNSMTVDVMAAIINKILNPTT